MSRPLKAGLDYFPHDTMAHADPKIASLMALYGAEGYAFYFILLEIVFRSENGRINIGKPSEKIGLAHSMCLKLQKFEKILASTIEIGCFDEVEFRENNVLTSNGVSKRIQKINNDRGHDRKRKETFKEKESNKEKEYKEKEKAKSGKLPENPRKTICHNSDEFRLSKLLLTLIKERNKDYKEPDMNSWAKHIDLMIRVDKRMVKEIESIIMACQKDEFWQNNILSTEKLRKQYDQLKLKLLSIVPPKRGLVL